MLTSCVYIAFVLLSHLISRVSSQEGDGETNDGIFKYQYQTSANIAECPSDDILPFVLNDPYISARTKAVILSYEVIVPDPEWITYEVFDPTNCTIPIPTGNSGSSSADPLIGTLDVKFGALTGAATAKLTLEVNEAGLKECGSMIYTETKRTGVAPNIESTGEVTLCVRMNIYNGLPSEATSTSNGLIQKVTWLDTETTFIAELDIEDEAILYFTVAVDQQRSCSGDGCRRQLENVPSTGDSHEFDRETDDATRNSKEDTITPAAIRQQRHLCETTWGMEIITCPPTIDENTTEPFPSLQYSLSKE